MTRTSVLLLLGLLVGAEVSAAPSHGRTEAQGRKRAPARTNKRTPKAPAAPPQAAEPPPPSAPPAEARPASAPARPRSPGQGTVTYVNSGRAYLDRGKEEGLTPGTELALTRRGRSAGSCRVEWVADHHATCQSQGSRQGDRFALPQRPEEPAPAPRPAPAAPALIAQWRAAIDATPHPLISFKGQRTSTRAPIDLRVGHTSWVTNTASPFHQERADVRLQGMPVALGLRLYLDATALGWTRRPSGFRSPARTLAQLYVREGELVAREPGQRLALAVGRVWPWFVPGVAVFDGAQIGWRSRDGDFEVGGFGGGVPDPVTLRPSFQRLAAGVYLAGRHSGEEDATVRLLQYETRVSYMSFPESSTRVEVEGRGRAWLGRHTDVGAWVRLGIGDAQAPAAVDAARVDVELRPHDTLRFSGAVRYDGTTLLDMPPLDGLDLGTRALHADVVAAWQPAPWFSAGLTGLLARDIETALARQLAGPELSFPRLFGSRGGVSLGYLEELGWQKGRSAHVQAVLQPFSALRLLTRVGYFEDSPIPEATDALPARDMSLYTSAEIAPAGWLTVRLSVLGRFDLTPPGEDATPSGGLVGHASLGGTF
ncbi:MAG: hypothetical protein JXB05_28055 [Myxococcaceae bacterium]|nr:hypothetical protein [Myxococcaceae bacterium]